MASVSALFARLHPIAVRGPVGLAWREPPPSLRRITAERRAERAAWRGVSPETIYADYEAAIRGLDNDAGRGA